VLTATSTSRNPNAWSSYFGSATFASLSESTHRTRRQILERFRAEHGDKAIAMLRKRTSSAWSTRHQSWQISTVRDEQGQAGRASRRFNAVPRSDGPP
jgi:hypothetical protein